MRGPLLLLSLLALPLTAVAKPLYLTVPRSFGTQEAPEVEVAFANQGPVELRVLRPRSLEAFLQTQSNLRRAYEPPPTVVNPGRALARGLNGVKEPGDFLLYALNPELRRALSPALPKAPETAGTPVGPLQEGPQKLVGIPPGMALVKSRWLNLDLGGDLREFNVPGFEAWSGRGGFQERKVVLEPLPAGVYVLQLVQGRVEGQVVLLVTDLSLQVKQTDGELLARVAGLDQLPKPGVKVQLRLPGGAGPTAITDEKGEARLSTQAPRVLVTASLGADTALVDTDFYSTLAATPDVFLYTDRPIYRPGDDVRFRGLVRRPDSFLARLFTPRRREVAVKLVSQGGREVSSQASIDEFGSFHGTLKAPADLDTGILRVMAVLEDRPHQGEARVQEYVKPTFYVEVLPQSEKVTPGEPLRVKLRARRYAGGAPANTAYEVFLYRSLLDTPSWVDDAGKGGAGSAVTYGSTSTTEGKLAVPERLYSTLAERSQAGLLGEDAWASAPKFDENGEAEVVVPVPALQPGDERLPWRYSLTVRARDDQETFASASAAFFLSKTELLGAVRFSEKVVKRGGQASLAVRSTTLGGRTYPTADGEVRFVLRDAAGREQPVGEESFRTDEQGTWRGAAPSTDGVGTLLARVTLRDRQGNPWAGETSLLLVGTGGEPVAQVPSLVLQTLEEVLTPGATGQLVALFPQGFGPGGQSGGKVWLTLSGSGLFSTQLLEVSGTTLLHPFEVEERFGSAVYASLAYPTPSGRWEERTLPFRIVPAERALTVTLTPERSEMAPLTEQRVQLRVTDHEGEGVVAQVSMGVVDKAVYAIQSELRPKVLDFFYPLGRNNVTSFFSNEFQGYGYGEALARRFGQLPHFRFAAVKPPAREVRQEEKDTAFWAPDVVTDREGRATVRFTVPSNQTLWTVTAVAADASGRFGEGLAEFATRGRVNLVTSAPQFLREGDTALASVRVSRGQKSKGGALTLALAATEALGGAQTKQALTLAPSEEAVVPVQLSAQLSASTPQGDSLLALSLSSPGQDTLTDRRPIPLRRATLEEDVEVRRMGGGELALTLPAQGQVRQTELVLSASTVDAALTNVRELLTYPYGCLEQLVSTTIPNVALFQTLQKVNALEKLDTDSQALLAEARSRAVQGMARILALSVKGGGFTWFGGYSEPSLPLTLIALDGLSYGLEAGLLSRNEPRLVESAAWLEAQADVPFELDAVRAYVLARLQGAQQAPRVRALVSQAAATSPLSVALAVLASNEAGVLEEPALKAQLSALVAESQRGFFQLADFDSSAEAFYRYPLRRVGMTALLGHAASLGDLDIAKARRRFLELLSSPELSTFDRSTAILHSLWLIERDAKELRRLPPPQVEGAGKLAWRPRGTGLVATVPPRTERLTVGSFDGVATLSARVEVPLSAVTAKEEGLAVARRYLLLSESGSRPLREGEEVPQGADVFVELTLDTRSENRVRSAYYVLVDGVPAGFVPLTEDRAFEGAPYSLPLRHEALKRRSLSPEKATFFFEEPTWWSRSPRTVGYVLRAQFPGRFTAPPAQVEDMYVASLRGRTPASILSVAPAKEPAPGAQ